MLLWLESESFRLCVEITYHGVGQTNLPKGPAMYRCCYRCSVNSKLGVKKII